MFVGADGAGPVASTAASRSVPRRRSPMRLSVTASIPQTMSAISSRAKRTSSSTVPCCSAVPAAGGRTMNPATFPPGEAALYIVNRSGTAGGWTFRAASTGSMTVSPPKTSNTTRLSILTALATGRSSGRMNQSTP